MRQEPAYRSVGGSLPIAPSAALCPDGTSAADPQGNPLPGEKVTRSQAMNAVPRQ
jgi:hypothetical protein